MNPFLKISKNFHSSRFLAGLFLLLPLYFSLMLLLSGCTKRNEQAQHQKAWLDSPKGLRVLCTTEMIEALVVAVGGDRIDTLSLVYGELDPHSYQLVKGDSQKIAKADIIFCNGLGLEHGPSLKAALEKHPQTVWLGDELLEQEPNLAIRHEEEIDPHLWLDVAQFAKLCPLIAEHLAAIDPSAREYYEAQSAQSLKYLNQLDQELREAFDAVPSKKRYLVTSHEAFYYLARAYLSSEDESEVSPQAWRQRFCAPEGLAPESQISLQRLLEISSYIKRHHVEAAFLEMNVNSDAIYKIQRALKSESYPLYIPSESLFSDCMPSIAHKNAFERYEEMICSNAQIILSAWGFPISDPLLSRLVPKEAKSCAGGCKHE